MNAKQAVVLFTIGIAFAADTAIGQDEQVYVQSSYLTDSDGYNYGATYWLDSTVNSVVCVVTTVTERTNVNGDVAGPFLLQPNEKHVEIGSFVAADQSQPWSVNVHAQWKEGDC